MIEDPKQFLKSLQNGFEGFSKVDKETLKAFGNLNENNKRGRWFQNDL